jgi:plastocyanin
MMGLAVWGLAGLFLVCCGRAEAADVVVSEQNMVFVPDHLTIGHGDRIVFHNDDDMAHQVIIMSGGHSDTALTKQHPGDTASLVLPDAGTVVVGCDFHPLMLLTVTVQ